LQTPEGKVKASVRKLLDPLVKLGYCYQYWPVPAGYGASTVDCIGCYRGRFFAIETKKKGGKPTPRQDFVLGNISLAGGKTFAISGPEGVEALRAWIEEVDR
jgi:hypothetical protein